MCTYKVKKITSNFVQAQQFESHFHYCIAFWWIQKLQKDLLWSIHKIIEFCTDLQSFQNIINMKNKETLKH